MASLTHVCMWSDNGWKHITADEAATLHPGGTVSAHSGLFMCELCGQYVLLTDGNYQVRHFRHSSREKSKNCPERTFGSGYVPAYIAGEHELPIRILDVTDSSFGFELGLLRVPMEMIDNDLKLEIRQNGINGTAFTYTKERLNIEGITYLSIGDVPFSEYVLSIQGGSDRLKAFWPHKIRGIDPDGTIFDQMTGKMLPYDADVETGKDYYLLKRGYLHHDDTKSGIRVRDVSRKHVNWLTWNLYSVSALEFSEGAARFFLEYHCRLTVQPVSFQPVWPLYVEGSYIIKCNTKNVKLLVRGDARAVKSFPPAPVVKVSKALNQSSVYEVQCNSRQQLISIGRTKALQYSYIWREPLDDEAQTPKVRVTETSGLLVNSGKRNFVPKDGILRFLSEYDGELMIYKGELLSERHSIFANKTTEVAGIGWRTHIKLIIGLDCFWEVDFQEEHSQKKSVDEIAVLKYITDVSGAVIPAPHALRNISLKLREYPRICSWIGESVKKGLIHEQSYRRLQKIYRVTMQEKNFGGKV